MNNKDVAALLGELIEADENESARLEKLLARYGVVSLFQRLDEGMPLSTESLEKLRALQLLIDRMSQRDDTELGEENDYGLPPHE
ncbi:hypothetical protein [Paenibacillus sp. 1P07SE]|uniref:hypothetical protein n=1 Tax=Paenibacillus sp. 1P07SE TaxID=3132209 RepID=UPI0039A6D478